MLRLWQQDVGIRFDHVLSVRRGQQYRHDEQCSINKLNHHAEHLPEAALSGYRQLIAQEGWGSSLGRQIGKCRFAIRFYRIDHPSRILRAMDFVARPAEGNISRAAVASKQGE